MILPVAVYSILGIAMYVRGMLAVGNESFSCSMSWAFTSPVLYVFSLSDGYSNTITSLCPHFSSGMP